MLKNLPNKPEGDKVMSNKFVIIFSALLKSQPQGPWAAGSSKRTALDNNTSVQGSCPNGGSLNIVVKSYGDQKNTSTTYQARSAPFCTTRWAVGTWFASSNVNTQKHTIMGDTNQTPKTGNWEVDDSICLLTKPIQLSFLLNVKWFCERTTKVDSDGLPEEGPENDIVGNKHQIEVSFLIAWIIWRRSWDLVGNEQQRCEWVGQSLRDVRCEEIPICP